MFSVVFEEDEMKQTTSALLFLAALILPLALAGQTAQEISEKPAPIAELSYDTLKNVPGLQKKATMRWRPEDAEVSWERLDFQVSGPSAFKVAFPRRNFSATKISLYSIVNNYSRGPLRTADVPSAVVATAKGGRAYIAIRRENDWQLYSASKEINWRLSFGNDEYSVKLSFGKPK